MRIIGVTGGIGSGKSTATNILASFGAKVIDADTISREIVFKGEKAWEELVECFGRDILDNNGEVNRKKLGEVVFNNKEKLGVLNTITHKYIVDKIIRQVNAEKDKGNTEILVVDAAIPVEHGFKDLVDEIWVIAADLEIRVKRIRIRNGLSRSEVLERINAQISDAEYFQIADRILYNNGSVEELKKEIVKLLG